MKKMNKKYMLLHVSIVLTCILTLVVATSKTTKSNASPFDYLKKIKISNCIITIDSREIKWTGEEIRPQITVTYNDNTLIENRDYILQYKNNVDAGRAKVIIKGINEYRGSKKIKFKILGINLREECTISKENGEINIFYGDKLLTSNDYNMVVSSETEHVPYSCEIDIDSKKAYVSYSYDITYFIQGKGQYIGLFYTTVTKTYEKEESVEKALEILKQIENQNENI